MLTAADNVSTFRFVVKNVARRNGVHATFMPKPVFGVNGSGMHTHQSLLRDGVNAFHDPDGPFELSRTCMNYIGGLLQHAEAFCAITNPLVNSYKRLLGGGEAPSSICWGHNNRSAMIRVPMYKPNKGQSTRIELRTIDAACNPYPAFAVVLAAALLLGTRLVVPAAGASPTSNLQHGSMS